MKHFLLTYTLSDDYLARREPLRAAHLALAQAAVDRGEIVLGGALTDPADRALILFAGEDAEAAKAFVAADPYVRDRLVTAWTVREWITVVGTQASHRVVTG